MDQLGMRDAGCTLKSLSAIVRRSCLGCFQVIRIAVLDQPNNHYLEIGDIHFSQKLKRLPVASETVEHGVWRLKYQSS